MLEAESVRKYVLAVDDDGRILTGRTETMTPTDAAVELERRLAAYAAIHGTSHEVALERVMADPDNAELVRVYLAVDDLGPHRYDDTGPSNEAHRRAREYMATRGCGYSEAATAVLAVSEQNCLSAESTSRSVPG